MSDATTVRLPEASRRPRSSRGQGDRLREELIEAALGMVGDSEAVTLRSVARRVGISATSVYLHFPDVDHLLAAAVQRCFEQLTVATTRAAEGAAGPVDELRRRCHAYCVFGLERPQLYRLMFQADIPSLFAQDPGATPGRRSFENLVAAVSRCLDAGAASSHDDPFRLASLIWTAEHGIVLARIARPSFPWAPLEGFVDEMIDRMMGLVSDRKPRPTSAGPRS